MYVINLGDARGVSNFGDYTIMRSLWRTSTDNKPGMSSSVENLERHVKVVWERHLGVTSEKPLGDLRERHMGETSERPLGKPLGKHWETSGKTYGRYLLERSQDGTSGRPLRANNTLERALEETFGGGLREKLLGEGETSERPLRGTI